MPEPPVKKNNTRFQGPGETPDPPPGPENIDPRPSARQQPALLSQYQQDTRFFHKTRSNSRNSTGYSHLSDLRLDQRFSYTFENHPRPCNQLESGSLQG